MLNNIKNIELLKLNNEKNYIIDLLYDNINFYNIKYQLISQIENLDELKQNEFYVIPHLLGIPCILILDNKFDCPIAIIKKNLKFYKNQININNIQMYKLYDLKSCKFNKKTIIDGKFSIINDNSIIYCIHDIYMYEDRKYFTELLIKKYKSCESLCDILNNSSSIITFKFVSLYTYDQLPMLIYEKIRNSKFKINGLIFLPIRTGKSFIYINDNEFSFIKSNYADFLKKYEYLDVPDIPLNIYYDDCEKFVDNNKKKELLIKKTKISDVYELYDIKINDESPNLYLNITQDNYIDIAHVPNIATSHFLKNKTDEINIFKCTCIYSPKFRKWIPIIK